MGIAVVFPGQGAQRPGMGRDLYEHHKAAHAVFELAQSQMDRSITELCFETDADTLRLTENAQPCLLTVGYAGWKALLAEVPDFQPDYFAGHSMGEYTALAAAGVWTFEEAFYWIVQRADAMSDVAYKLPGTMVALIGINAPEADLACQKAQDEGAGIVIPANYNCPGQVVISGAPEAVERAVEYAKELGAKRAIPLAVAGAFHSPIMATAAELIRQAYENANFRDVPAPVVSNVTARPVTNPEEWREVMSIQIASPVRWQESVEWMASQGVDTFIEVGVGDVLSGLIKRCAPGVHCYHVVDMKTLQETVEQLRNRDTAGGF